MILIYGILIPNPYPSLISISVLFRSFRIKPEMSESDLRAISSMRISSSLFFSSLEKLDYLCLWVGVDYVRSSAPLKVQYSSIAFSTELLKTTVILLV
jgi:hypothetical protein